MMFAPRISTLGARASSTAVVRAARVLIATPSSSASRHTTTRHTAITRAFASKPPGSNPLEILRKECMARNLCDEEGSRLPGVHWVFSLAITPPDLSMPPNCRTVGIERISDAGIDFVMKQGSGTAKSVAGGTPVAMLHQQGKFLPGEHAEQWRGEGACAEIELGDVLDLIPHFTVTSMVASSRIAAEKASGEASEGVSDGRMAMQSKSHLTEVMQKTRIELENGDVSLNELKKSISALRFQPTRMECMLGGPDTVMWDRWEWLRDPAVTTIAGEALEWAEPKHLVPH